MPSRQQQTWTGDLDLGEFRRICREVVEAVADYHADLSRRGAPPDFTPEDVRAVFAEEFSEGREPHGVLLADWRVRVVPRLAALSGLRELFSHNLSLAGRLHGLVREHPDFELLHEPALFLYCFRYVPNGLAERREEPGVQDLLDRLNGEIVEAVRRGGRGLLTTTRVRGRVAIRTSVRSHRTSVEDTDATFEAAARCGRLLFRSHSARYERPPEMEASPCSSASCSSPTELSAT